MSLTIDLHKKPEESIKELMQEKLDKCRQALQAQSDSHEAIHKVRKELKKTRAICRLVRDEIGEDAYHSAQDFFRDTARKLSPARDASALLETLYKVEKELPCKNKQPLLKKIKNHLIAKKAALTRVQINQQQLLQTVLEDLKDAEQYFSPWTFHHQDFTVFRSSIERVYKRCRKGLKSAYKEGTAEAFHQWRKRVKYLKYQGDTLTPVWPKPMAALADELNTLTDYLGDEHDLSVFQEYIQQTPFVSDSYMKELLENIITRRHRLQKQAKPLGHKLFYLKPPQFSGLLENWWNNQTASQAISQEELVSV